MKINKWTKFRILLVFIGLIFSLTVILLRFAFLQLKDQVIIGIILILLYGSIMSIYIIYLSGDISSDAIKNKKYKIIPKKYLSIIDLLVSQKLKNCAIAYYILFCSFIINIVISNYWLESIKMWCNMLILLIMFFIFVNVMVLEYRITNGYYGTNDYEAREIIIFILSNMQDIDYKGDDYFKNLFADIEHDIEYIRHGYSHDYKGVID